MTGRQSTPVRISPSELAALVRPLLDRTLIAFDVDGVLAPIVEHADDSTLTPGVHEALAALGERTVVAILSGRSLESLDRLFDFPVGLHVVGSHGLEVRDAEPVELDDRERAVLDALERLGRQAVADAGQGAWLEHKPASVVLHTRSADPGLARPAAAALTRLAGQVGGATVKPGHEVVELLARTASKGEALIGLADRLERSPVVFLGDDVTDEDAFRRMADDDVSVRVGPGETDARFRLADADAVADFLAELGG